MAMFEMGRFFSVFLSRKFQFEIKFPLEAHLDEFPFLELMQLRKWFAGVELSNSTTKGPVRVYNYMWVGGLFDFWTFWPNFPSIFGNL